MTNKSAISRFLSGRRNLVTGKIFLPSALLWTAGVTQALAGSFFDREIQPPPDAFGVVLHPLTVVRVVGDVTNQLALSGGAGQTTLAFVAGQKPPMVVLDYGRDVGGVPEIDITSVSGAPVLSEIYSESLINLLPDGDGAPGFANSPGDPDRIDKFAVGGPGFVINRQVQGGERYQAISLLTPGSVTIRLAGVKSLTADPPPSDNTGHFDSSDPLLNTIWNLGARTLQLCEVPAGSLPPLLSLTSDGVLTDSTPRTVYQYGTNWKDYTTTVEAKILRNEATIVLRSSLFHTLNLTFRTDGDRLGTPNQLDVWESGVFGNQDIAAVKLPFNLKTGAWHSISANLRGGSVTVLIDRQLVGTYKTASTTGSVGFRAPSDGLAVFRDLVVADAGGKILYRFALKDPDTLDQFAAATNRLPVIVDGGKRDRLVWLGDLSLSEPTVFYTSAESKYVWGSLQLLGSFRQKDGEISSDAAPVLDPDLGTSAVLPDAAGFYSLPYSIYFVNTAYEYLLYTGDKGFIISHWEMLKREMNYLAANAGPDHLIYTGAANGLDWAIQTQTGAVTEYNALYFRALQNSSAMARLLGDDRYAARLDVVAAQVKQAINAELFDTATGVYDASSDHRGTYAQDANVMAALYGIAAPARATAILAKISAVLDTPNGPRAFSDGTGLSDVISPFVSGFEVEARFESGDEAGALALIRKLWGPMAVPSAYYTGGDFEALGSDGNTQMPTRTLAHGWSTAPTAALSKYVLGVRPTSPGFATWLIRPELGNLRWAKGEVPTPHGPISVDWTRSSGRDLLVIDALAPSGTSGVIAVPTLGGAVIYLNGKPQRGSGESPAQAQSYFNLAVAGGGAYHIEVTN